MANAAASLAIQIELWTIAKNRFLYSLHEDGDKKLFDQASLDNIFHIASAGIKHHEVTSKIAHARKKVMPMFESLDGYSKALDVLSQSSATILCPLWGSLRIVPQLALSYGKYYDKALDIYERIGDLLPRFRSYERLFSSHPQLLVYLADAYLEIVQFSYDASRVFALPERTTQKMFRVTIKTRFKPLKDRLEQCTSALRRHGDNVRNEAEIAHMIESQTFQQLVISDRSLQKRQDDLRKTKDVLSTYGYHVKHSSIRSLRCNGTCSWLPDSEAARAWMQDATPEPFCCYGIPGAGRTILASAIIDAVLTKSLPVSIQNPPAAVCYHYCDYAEDTTLDATKIIASLARQLLDLSPLGIAALLERCRNAIDNKFSATWEDSIFCLEQALKVAGGILLVFDGVDRWT
jgi:tetratricopeptide (TPR) repeat protein